MLTVFGRVALLLVLFLCAHPAAIAQRVPDGFKAEVLYQAPDIEHPSVVTCDDEGNLFVGEDPMDMRGPSTEEFDRVLMIRFDAEGKPARKTVFCEKLSAVFGLLWHDGALYVMHAPHYSVFRDTDGDGVADERRDLAEGFGPPAGVFGFNDHIVSGIRMGLDGLVYVSVGDKGIARATGADGSAVTLEGGGIVRMRPDGTQLEAFTSGTRNHLDLAFDSLDNIFTYDNTDDGLGWWTRLTHHVQTGYYGYPYDYHPHPERHLPPISDHGGGSPCGGACYRDASWPAAYRDSAFFCEWGKGKIQRFTFEKSGATFKAQIEDFMTREGEGEFRPQDCCFSPDGKSMYVADWNYGGWLKNEQHGRLFRVTYVGEDVKPEPARTTDAASLDEQLAALAHPAFSERARAQAAIVRGGQAAVAPLTELLAADSTHPRAKVHALWAQNALIDKLDGYDPSSDWIARLKDASPRVAAQAARALGLRRVKAGEAALIEALAYQDATVRLQAAVALGRIGDPAACEALWTTLADDDRFVSFAAMQALRAINNWDTAARKIDEATRDGDSGAEEKPARAIVALTGVYDAGAVKALTEVASAAQSKRARGDAIEALAEVARRADPYTGGWWGTQPARGQPARPKKHDWDGTPVVLAAIRQALEQSSPEVRLGALTAVKGLEDRDSAARLRAIAETDEDVRVRRQAMTLLSEWNDSEVVGIIGRVLAAATDDETRREAAGALAVIKTDEAHAALVALIGEPMSSPEVVSLCLGGVAEQKLTQAHDAVVARLTDGHPKIRIAAAKALAALDGSEAVPRLLEMLADQDAEVRKAVIVSLSGLKSAEAVPALIAAAADEATRDEAVDALIVLPDARALQPYLTALASSNVGTRERARGALAQIREQVADEILALHERNELPAGIFAELDRVYSLPAPIVDWRILGAYRKNETLPLDPAATPDLNAEHKVGDRTLVWKENHTDDPQGKVSLHRFVRPREGVWTWAYAELASATGGPTQLNVGSDDQLKLYVNGKLVYEFDANRGWAPDQGQVEVELVAGANQVLALVGNDGGPYEFSVQAGQRDPRFAFLARPEGRALDAAVYREFALANEGNAEHGAALFNDAKGLGCVKCHAVGGGAKAGPDLAGVGTKYAKDELIRSVLEPSSRLLSGYEMSTVITTDGRALQGVIKIQNDEVVELIDQEGKTVRLAAGDVDEIERSSLSMMPAGLKDGLTPADFADVIAYLVSLKDQPAAGGE